MSFNISRDPQQPPPDDLPELNVTRQPGAQGAQPTPAVDEGQIELRKAEASVKLEEDTSVEEGEGINIVKYLQNEGISSDQVASIRGKLSKDANGEIQWQAFQIQKKEGKDVYVYDPDKFDSSDLHVYTTIEWEGGTKDGTQIKHKQKFHTLYQLPENKSDVAAVRQVLTQSTLKLKAYRYILKEAVQPKNINQRFIQGKIQAIADDQIFTFVPRGKEEMFKTGHVEIRLGGLSRAKGGAVKYDLFKARAGKQQLRYEKQLKESGTIIKGWDKGLAAQQIARSIQKAKNPSDLFKILAETPSLGFQDVIKQLSGEAVEELNSIKDATAVFSHSTRIGGAFKKNPDEAVKVVKPGFFASIFDKAKKAERARKVLLEGAYEKDLLGESSDFARYKKATTTSPGGQKLFNVVFGSATFSDLVTEKLGIDSERVGLGRAYTLGEALFGDLKFSSYVKEKFGVHDFRDVYQDLNERVDKKLVEFDGVVEKLKVATDPKEIKGLEAKRDELESKLRHFRTKLSEYEGFVSISRNHFLNSTNPDSSVGRINALESQLSALKERLIVDLLKKIGPVDADDPHFTQEEKDAIARVKLDNLDLNDYDSVHQAYTRIADVEESVLSHPQTIAYGKISEGDRTLLSALRHIPEVRKSAEQAFDNADKSLGVLETRRLYIEEVLHLKPVAKGAEAELPPDE